MEDTRKFTNDPKEVAARERAYERWAIGAEEMSNAEITQAIAEASVRSVTSITELLPESENHTKAKNLMRVLSAVAQSLAYVSDDALAAMAEDPSELLEAVNDNYGYRLTNKAEVPADPIFFTDYASGKTADFSEACYAEDPAAQLSYLDRDSLIAIACGFYKKLQWALAENG